jgi:hypothetical protein
MRTVAVAVLILSASEVDVVNHVEIGVVLVYARVDHVSIDARHFPLMVPGCCGADVRVDEIYPVRKRLFGRLYELAWLYVCDARIGAHVVQSLGRDASGVTFQRVPVSLADFETKTPGLISRDPLRSLGDAVPEHDDVASWRMSPSAESREAVPGACARTALAKANNSATATVSESIARLIEAVIALARLSRGNTLYLLCRERNFGSCAAVQVPDY